MGEAVCRALDVAVASIERHPEAHVVIHRNTRRVLLPKFPYGLYYRVPLLLAFEQTRSGHDDVVLSLGDYVHRCDSYYFGVEASDGVYPHHLAVMTRMLDQWRECLEHLAEGDHCFLPFDFSDQCTAWLRCELAGGEVTICAGWSSIEGWSFLPSDFSAYAGDVRDWRAIENSAAITTSRSALLTQIAASQETLRSQASTLESDMRAGDRRTKR